MHDPSRGGTSHVREMPGREPPDDRIDITGPVVEDAGTITIPFAWRRDGARASMRVARRGERIERLVVAFG